MNDVLIRILDEYIIFSSILLFTLIFALGFWKALLGSRNKAWRELARQYEKSIATTEPPTLRGSWLFINILGKVPAEYRSNMTNFYVLSSGLYIKPNGFFIFMKPIFIPWKDVEAGDSVIIWYAGKLQRINMGFDKFTLLVPFKLTRSSRWGGSENNSK